MFLVSEFFIRRLLLLGFCRSGQYYSEKNNMAVILRGSFHQGSERFGPETRGRQCTAIAFCAIAKSQVLDLHRWTAADIDNILVIGDSIYQLICQYLYGGEYRYLNHDDLRTAIDNISPDMIGSTNLIADRWFGMIGTQENASFDLLQVTGAGHVHRLTGSIGVALSSVRDRSFQGILTLNTYSVALFVRGGAFFVFDSHSRGYRGNIVENGAAVLLRFATVSALSAYLTRLYAISHNFAFELSEATFLSDIPTAISSHSGAVRSTSGMSGNQNSSTMPACCVTEVTNQGAISGHQIQR